ncbi:DUF167 domain-containing protein [Desulfurella sp.]|uniref:DUF167 domain-containing protein n=1 Tax=Desulfurella sp. TaxID=1962857 RepID=UPI0025C6D764|nr:DUF167 domain-containing protein [Desulfurella sp.]
MIVHLKVIANAKRDLVCGMEGGFLKVKVSKPAQEGRANKAVVSLISSFFDIKKSAIKILSGEKSNIKILDLDIEEEFFNSKLHEVIKDAHL